MKKIFLILFLFVACSSQAQMIQLVDSLTSTKTSTTIAWQSNFDITQIVIKGVTADDTLRIYAMTDSLTSTYENNITHAIGGLYQRDSILAGLTNMSTGSLITDGKIAGLTSPVKVQFLDNAISRICIKATDVTLSGTIKIRIIGVVKPK